MSSNRNIEIKARVSDLSAVRSKAAAIAASSAEILEQRDTFFAVPRGRLKVREFPDGSGELISYERANEPGPRECVYARFACENVRVLSQCLSSVLPTLGIVVKHREVFLVGRTRIHLDQVENLGSFVELEVVLTEKELAVDGEREARELLQKLEIPQATLVAGAYIDLLEDAAV